MISSSAEKVASRLIRTSLRSRRSSGVRFSFGASFFTFTLPEASLPCAVDPLAFFDVDVFNLIFGFFADSERCGVW